MRSAMRAASVFFEQPGEAALSGWKDQVRMGQGQGVVHGDHQAGYVPDRKKGVSGGKVHEIQPGPGHRSAHRQHVADPPPTLGRSGRAGCLADVYHNPIAALGNCHR